ncbi:MAG: hypothetical protein AB7T06_01045 [Kofleriaceae bacterium]
MSLALVRTGAPTALGASHPTRPAFALFGTILALSVGIFAAGMPLLSLGLISAAMGAFYALAPDLDDALKDITSLEVRETYRAVLFSFARLELAADEARELRDVTGPVLERCANALDACSRLARTSNRMQRYLEAHDPVALRAEIDRLNRRAEATSDARAISALGHAAAARARQLEMRDEVLAQRERIIARLELARATFEAHAAQIAKLRGALDAELVEDERIDDAGEGLRDFETALRELAA